MRPVTLGCLVALWAGLCAGVLAQDATGRVSGGPEARGLAHGVRAGRFLRGRKGAASGAANLAAARGEDAGMLGNPRTATLGVAWAAVGPAQVLTARYGLVTGRVSSVAVDPGDATGNTVYLGTTGGGVWRSVNAAGAADAVRFAALTDNLPVFNVGAGSGATASLSIGAVSVGAGGVVLAGTGDPNDATDSYYGGGVLRSGDGGATWTLAVGSDDGVAGRHSFVGLGFAGFAWSGVNPAVVVAAVSEAAEGVLVNAADATYSVKGLYYSVDAGISWHMAGVFDGSQTVQTADSVGTSGGNAATAVVWNGVRKRFYAAVRLHGYYESADGQTWTRLAHQPGAGLTGAACPVLAGQVGSAGCPIYRGALAVATGGTGDMFALTVDGANRDTGLYEDLCGGTCAGAVVQFGAKLASGPLEVGNGSAVIAQGDYNLALAAVGTGSGSGAGAAADTVLYVGTEEVFRCTVAGGCALRNTTNAASGCTNPAGVAAGQHAIATGPGGLVFFGNDGGIWRSVDGVAETGAACSVGDAGHFQNLNGGLGSLAEVVSFAQDPADRGVVLAGLGALGTAATGGGSGVWGQVAAGEGGTVAISQTNPAEWYVSTGAGVSIGRCARGAACTAADFAGAPAIGPAQVAGDRALVDAPFLLDPADMNEVIVGTCRVWRGPGLGGGLWSSGNLLSRPFGAPAATACGPTFPLVRSLGAGGAAGRSGSEAIYAGLAGTLDGGAGFGGHVFATAAAGVATGATVWADLAKSPVTNDLAGVFNPGGFDVSSVVVDGHDATGKTVYSTVMGFAGNGVNAAHVYRSVDGGAHWVNVSSNLPNAPANSVAVDPNDANTVYVALDTGVYVATAVGTCAATNCWSVYGAGLPNAPVVQLLAGAALATGDGRVGVLRAATYGRGIWEVALLTAISPAAPGIAVSPAAVVFGSTAVGTQSAAQMLTVTDTGTAPLTVSSVVASGDFVATNTCVGAPVVQGATCTVTVRFAPGAVGAQTGVLTVYGNAPGGQATAALSGTGVAGAAIVLTPGSLLFPAAIVGGTTASQAITIANAGGTAAGLASVRVTGDFRIAGNTCGASLAPQTSCTVLILFAPTAAGARTGALTVVDDAGTQTAGLSGEGDAPATDALSAATLSFGPQVLSTASAGQTVTLINAGDVALPLIAAAVTAGDFTVVNGCGTSLNARSSCVLTVGFVPRSVGAQTGVLQVSDQFRTQSVALNGTGLAPAGVSLSPVGGLGFGAVAVGSTSAVQTVTLTNNGGVALLISGVAATGDFAIATGTNTCGASVGPGAVCSVGVVFAPTVAGARAGVLTVASSAAGSPENVALSGAGVDFSLAASGPTTETLASGKVATYALLLGSAAGVTGNAVFTCAGAPVHASCTVNPGSVALGGGNTPITVTVATGLNGAVERSGWGWALLLPVLLVGRRRKRLIGVLGVLVCLAGCSTARTLPGSGGGSVVAPPPVTPAGTYTLVVAASSAGLVRAVDLTVVVQ